MSVQKADHLKVAGERPQTADRLKAEGGGMWWIWPVAFVAGVVIGFVMGG